MEEERRIQQNIRLVTCTSRHNFKEAVRLTPGVKIVKKSHEGSPHDLTIEHGTKSLTDYGLWENYALLSGWDTVPYSPRD